jgi:hypothetical protein
MNSLFAIEKDRKKTKRYAWTATIIYLVLFPLLCMIAIASIMVFDSPVGDLRRINRSCSHIVLKDEP